ncbi:MAG: hypothetical protein ACE3L7_11260 [Candidatus Pristimantibacillus sp.]
MKKLPEDEVIHKALNREMKDAPQFTEAMMNNVMKRVKRVPWWEIEVRIPWQAAAAIVVMLLAVPTIGWLSLTADDSSSLLLVKQEEEQPNENDSKYLLVMGEGIYLKSELNEGWRESE